MMKSTQFKVLQRRLKFRNPNHLLDIPAGLNLDPQDLQSAEEYISQLEVKKINYTYPGHDCYPAAFLKMKEPPLFLEYVGNPFWKNSSFISVVGSREISSLTTKWMKSAVTAFLNEADVGLVSGGARGVDQLAHLLSLKSAKPTVFVLPSGLSKMYPENLEAFQTAEFAPLTCFMSEFESEQRIHKSHFYFRNRLIAALGDFTLVAQASLKSGSLLTVHHCLENGKPVLVIPSHPEVLGFEGNLKLIRDGAFPVSTTQDLLDFWFAEFHSK